MDNWIDILIAEDGDIAFRAGDLDFGNANIQDVDATVQSNQGDWKQWPLVGVGIYNYLNAPTSIAVANQLKRTISLQLADQGFKAVNVSLLNGIEKIGIKAERE